MDLNHFWLLTLGVLLAGYAILDGFDLGVGILHLRARGDTQRRILMNAIGPLWDGNEVWLVTFGGALFAAFPHAYATAFSAFYLPFMLLLFALILRAASIEFRGKRNSAAWRACFDGCFFAASTLATFLFGVTIGNCLQGIPIGPDLEFSGSLSDLVRPYPVLVGLLAVATFAMHGSIYLHLKTEGELQQRVRGWMWQAYAAFLLLYAATTIYSLVAVPGSRRSFQNHPWLWPVVAVNISAIIVVGWAMGRRRAGLAFLASSCSIAALLCLLGAATYPNLLISSSDPAWSLDIYKAASSPKTLRIMQIIALIGMPLVLAYTILIHWVFRGKVRIGKSSY